jgi:hypothetical protein
LNTYNNISLQFQRAAFDLELLGKVNEVKDTTKKCPLTVHLVRIMIKEFSSSTDLSSELPHVHRVATEVKLTQSALAMT